jgi:hypothetical protein
MDSRHSDNDGSDIFWPGYVDAVTNLVLNLLFLLTIMTVAVFMFALELGRASQGGPEKPSVASTKQDAEAVSKATTDPVKENIALKREIQRLNMKLAQQVSQNGQPVQPSGLVKTLDVTSIAPKPPNKLNKTLASDFEIIVRFTDEAVAFTPAEHDQFLESLKPMVASEKTSIYVEVPTGFSEAKRMGFYRAMAVRNLLIEMKMPNDRIDVSVREVQNNANASIVRVRSH